MSKEHVEPKAVGTVEDDWEGQVAHDLQSFEFWPSLEDLEFAFLIENEWLAWDEDCLLLTRGWLFICVIPMLLRRRTKSPVSLNCY